jgi:Domain of unknown function DUF11/RTX calcium-binding nonapeptide repeat (4 copies)/WD40-like Beta Propeller Repeat
MRLAALAALTAGAGLALAGSAAATYPGGNGRLAYIKSDDSVPSDVYTANPDGSDRRNLTSDIEGLMWSVAWSPDGTRLAFIEARPHPSDREVPSRWALWVMNGDGSAKRLLHVFRAWLPDPAWSPDGSEIAVPRLVPRSHYEIAAVRVDGSGVRSMLALREHLPLHPSWSPDGSQVVFAGLPVEEDEDEDEETKLFVAPAGGGTARLLTTGIWPEWSPDGARILFVGPRGVATVEPSGDDVRVLVSRGSDWSPTWSPDGTKILFPATGPGANVLRTMNADGTCPTPIGEGLVAHSPDWQPVAVGPPSQPIRCVDLAVRARVNHRSGRVGRSFVVDAAVVNRGNEPAPSARLVDRLPPQLKLARAEPTKGTCAGERIVTCDFGTLAPGERVDVRLVLAPRAGGFLSHVLTVSSDARDPDDANDETFHDLFVCSHVGSDRADVIRGTAGADYICANAGDDRVMTGGGNDLVRAASETTSS